MSVVISDDILYASRMREDEFLQEIALWLYQQKRLSMGKACKLAKMPRIQFQHLLASRNIPINYDIEDFEADIQTLKDMGAL